MPHIDARSGDIVIRIVYDGAPEAGKTTNVRQLASLISLQRRGQLKSPGTVGERTEFFDWLDFSGGFVDGRRVRCQLVSVPGQPRLLHRRRYLIDSADAVVFVADSRSATFGHALRNISTTLRMLERSSSGSDPVGASAVPAGFILQANKQDLEGALPPAEVMLALGLEEATPVVGSAAATGAGVMETFILAVRLATDRVRAIVGAHVELAIASEASESLHAAMIALDLHSMPPPEDEPQHEPEASGAAPEPAAAASAPEPVDLPGVSAIVDVAPVRGGAASEEARPPEPALRPRRNTILAVPSSSLPQAPDISPGCVWPPTHGRASIAQAMAGAVLAPLRVTPWAPIGALEVFSSAGWRLHSSDRWIFESESVAQRRLISIVRRLLPRVDLVPEGRVLAVAPDGARWRLWVATRDAPTLLDEARAALDEGEEALEALALRVEGILRLLRAHGLDGPIPGGAGGIALQEKRAALLVVDEEDAPLPEARAPLADLASLVRAGAAGRPGLLGWLERAGLAPQAPTPGPSGAEAPVADGPRADEGVEAES
jgi:signal recognition particle receptor subunit beta